MDYAEAQRNPGKHSIGFGIVIVLHVLLGYTDYDLATEERLIRAMLSRRPEAIVVTGGHHTPGARTLMERPDRYGPLFTMDKRNGDIIWELWIDGFEKAVALRPAAWETLLNADPDTEAAICGMLGLVAVASGDDSLSEKESDALSEAAPDNIGPWIVTLNEWRLANYRPAQGIGLGPNPFPAPTKKAGRNDPCPCGSGKKYKKCCGLN